MAQFNAQINRETLEALAKSLQPESLALLLSYASLITDGHVEMLNEATVDDGQGLEFWISKFRGTRPGDTDFIDLDIARQDLDDFLASIPEAPCPDGLALHRQFSGNDFVAHQIDCPICGKSYPYIKLIWLWDRVVNTLVDIEDKILFTNQRLFGASQPDMMAGFFLNEIGDREVIKKQIVFRRLSDSNSEP